MSDLHDTTPNQNAYLTEGGYKGRFVSNIANVRLFQDNPYIRELDEATRIELNESLLKPYNGEMFYDDEAFLWVVKIEKNPITGSVEYNYYSKEKEVNDKLKYYETQGVLNQLMSAYNNGRVYKLFVNRDNFMVYPNTSLVFPSEFESYTIRAQNLNANHEYVYVAGTAGVIDGVLLDTHIAMRTVIDTVKGTTYKRMVPGKIFETSNPDMQYDQMVNGEFYVIDFYDKEGEIVDTKLFQACDSSVINTKNPSQSVTDLRITVLRNGLPETSANGVYPILAGEDLTNTVSFGILAVYNDGTVKVITDKLDTGNLSIDGMDENTTAAVVGTQFPVTFTYYPTLDSEGIPISSGISKTISFQVVTNTSEIINKIIPVMWRDNPASTTSVRNYRLKVYTLSQKGILENRSRAFYDTFRKVVDGNLVEYDDTIYSYDPYNQSMVFSFPPNVIGETTTFNFRIYNNAISTNYRFTVRFGADDADINGYYITPLAGTNDYGYDPASGPMRTLPTTYGVGTSSNNQLMLLNTINVNSIEGNGVTSGYQFTLTSHTDDSFYNRYSQVKDGIRVYPTRVQFFVVKDQTQTPLTAVTQFSTTVKNMTVTALADDVVRGIIRNLDNREFILAKFSRVTESSTELIDFDVFSVIKNFS